MKADKSKQKLEKVLQCDRLGAGEDFIRVVSRDLYDVLSEYFQPMDRSLETRIIPLSEGGYLVDIKMNAVRIKNVRIIE